MDAQVENISSSAKWCILACTTVIILTIWWKSLRGQPKGKRDIKYVSTIPIITSIVYGFIFRPVEQIKAYPVSDFLLPIMTGLCHLFYKEKVIQDYWAGRRYVMCFDPTICEKVFQSSAAINKDGLYKLLEPWLGKGLLTSGDSKWRSRRKMLTPAFHFRILKDFLVIFNQHSKVLVERFMKHEGQVVDITTVVPLCTLDIIAETAMGVNLNAQTKEGVEYVEAIKYITSSTVKPFTNPWFWITPIYYFSSVGRERRRNIEIVHNFARNVIRKRKQKFLEDGEINAIQDDFEDFGDDTGTKKRRVFLDLLLYHHLTDNSLSEEEIREEVDTFMFEGHDTTSMAICWSLYLLGLNKEVQEKAFQELYEIYGDDKDRTVTAEEMNKMKYLECIIKETLRLFPSVPSIVRRNSEDIEAGDYVIPANSSVALYIYGIHRNPEIYPNPEVFDPDRFLPENSIGRHPFAYVPFSAGFRNCIGQRFAMMEVKTVLSYLIRNFTISSMDHRDALNFVGDIILRPKEQLRLIFLKR